MTFCHCQVIVACISAQHIRSCDCEFNCCVCCLYASLICIFLDCYAALGIGYDWDVSFLWVWVCINIFINCCVAVLGAWGSMRLGWPQYSHLRVWGRFLQLGCVWHCLSEWRVTALLSRHTWQHATTLHCQYGTVGRQLMSSR